MNNSEEMKGLKIHVLVTIFLMAILIIVNVLVVPEFLWLVFTLLGMTFGVGLNS